jgi:Tol biopolymer transport system component
MLTRHVPLKLASIIGLAAVAMAARGDDPNWAIYVMKVDGTQVRKIAQAEGHLDHTSPRWSHDDKRVVFDASGGARGNREFYVVNADGSGLRQLGIDGRADWSPDDKQVAFESSSGNGEILVQNLDGVGRETIARGRCGRWSPDGSQMAVMDYHRMFVVDLATGEEHALFDDPFEAIFGGYNWSPDGKWLAFSGRPKKGVPRQIVLVNSQGAAQGMKVRFEGEQGGSISFSPDGKRLVFDNGYKIYLIDVDRTAGPRLVGHQKGKNKDPHWSHDGNWIVYSGDPEAR